MMDENQQIKIRFIYNNENSRITRYKQKPMLKKVFAFRDHIINKKSLRNSEVHIVF